MSDRCSDDRIRMQCVATGPNIHPACHADRIPLGVGYLPGLVNILWFFFFVEKKGCAPQRTFRKYVFTNSGKYT